MNVQMIAVLVLSCLLSSAGGKCLLASDDKPPALLAAERARDASLFWTARIEYSLRRSNSDESRPTHTRFFTWRSAGDEYLNVNRGAEDGIIHRDSSGGESPITYKGPVYALMKDDRVWVHTENSPVADVMKRRQADAFGLFDFRKLGVNGLWRDVDLDEVVAAAGYPPLEYESTQDNGLELVTASTTGGKFQWWIDPEKAWNVVKAATWMNGRQIGETRYELSEFDGIWFPKRMEHYRLAAGDVEPSTVLDIISAEFNRPEHPLQLTLENIGIEVGTMLTLMDQQPTVGGYWDGMKLTSWDDLITRVNSGELSFGPTVSRESARLRALAQRRKSAGDSAAADSASQQSGRALHLRKKKAIESEWQAYTRRFIAAYRLNKAQEQKALDILKTCQAGGSQYLARNKAGFEKLESLEKDIQLLKSPDRADLPKKRAQLEALRAELRAPIDEIFEKQLKPRLDKLPTRA